MSRVAIYARVSTSKQARQETSIPEQVRRCREWARERADRVVAVYRDEGASGAAERPALVDALEGARLRRFDVLVALNLSRIARTLTDQEGTIAKLDELGVAFQSVEEPDVMGDDPIRVAIRQMLGVMHQLDRALIIRRLQNGRDAARRAGRHWTGQPRYGFKVEGGRLVPHPDEQATVAVIARRRARKASWRTIAGELNAAGRRARGGGEWHPNTLRRIHDRGNKPG